LELEKYFPKRFQVGLGVMIGAGLGNTASDFLAGLASLNWSLALGTGLGCLIGLLLIPILHKIKTHYG
ncbi:N-acetyl-anhydromuranmyl-L-alanine amidase, partial [Methylophilaceae bacterium]|nr:N-acetyl-anhydromuranmyl-L-alanine amidase [Methylophilaceae bacterium]